jgi:hypothetical protein
MIGAGHGGVKAGASAEWFHKITLEYGLPAQFMA